MALCLMHPAIAPTAYRPLPATYRLISSRNHSNDRFGVRF